MYDLTITQMIRHIERHQLDVYANLLGRWVNLTEDENSIIAPFNEWDNIQTWAAKWLKAPQEGFIPIYHRGQIYFIHASQIQVVTNPKEQLRLPVPGES